MLIFAGRPYPGLLRLARRAFPVQVASRDPGRLLGTNPAIPPNPFGTNLSTGDNSSELQRIAQCESSGNPGAISPDGTYRGKYQFSRETWRELGGTGDPASAPVSVQDEMAVKLMQSQGPGAWPNCA